MGIPAVTYYIYILIVFVQDFVRTFKIIIRGVLKRDQYINMEPKESAQRSFERTRRAESALNIGACN